MRQTFPSPELSAVLRHYGITDPVFRDALMELIIHWETDADFDDVATAAPSGDPAADDLAAETEARRLLALRRQRQVAATAWRRLDVSTETTGDDNGANE